jgi:DNA polymerase-3 subunit epsilon
MMGAMTSSQEPLFDLAWSDFLPKGVERLAFVDLETTGGSAMVDRTTEIGIIEVDAQGVREWSTLVNPQMPIPRFIQKLTGITDDMVREAPTFEALAPELTERLHGALFVAHNAPFDHGFLKHEFTRVDMPFEPAVVCTVKLSRRLFPEHKRHNLDAVVERHGITLPESERHRALGDARAVWAFWQQLCRTLTPEAVHAALRYQAPRVPKAPAVPRPPRR